MSSQYVPTRPELIHMVEFRRKAKGDPPGETLLFHRPGGKPHWGSSLSNTWFPAVVRLAGLRETLTPHSLRHTCASHLIDAGANIKAVSRFLRHTNVELTLKTYTHLMPDTIDNLADTLAQIQLQGTKGAPPNSKEKRPDQ
jgi:integrase